MPPHQHAVADEKELRVDQPLFPRRRDDILIFEAGRNDFLPFHNAGNRLDFVAHGRRFFKFQRVRMRLHPAAQFADQFVLFPLQKQLRFCGDAAIFFHRAFARAGRETAMNLIFETGAGFAAVCDFARAEAQREKAFQQAERLLQRAAMHVGAEIERAILPEFPHREDSRKFFLNCQRNIWKIFIIFENHVVRRQMLFDERGLKNQGFQFRIRDNVFDVRDLRHHRGDAQRRQAIGAEIRAHALPQPFRLADV